MHKSDSSNFHAMRIQALFRGYRVRKLLLFSIKEFIGLGEEIESFIDSYNPDYSTKWYFTNFSFTCDDFLHELNIFEKIEIPKNMKINVPKQREEQEYNKLTKFQDALKSDISEQPNVERKNTVDLHHKSRQEIEAEINWIEKAIRERVSQISLPHKV